MCSGFWYVQWALERAQVGPTGFAPPISVREYRYVP
jgi:hypothetical protein